MSSLSGACKTLCQPRKLVAVMLSFYLLSRMISWLMKSRSGQDTDPDQVQMIDSTIRRRAQTGAVVVDHRFEGLVPQDIPGTGSGLEQHGWQPGGQ